MKTFNTLFEAFLEAGKACRQWESPRRPGVVYNAEELSEIATINDMNYPLESNDVQYAVFPDGELCMVNFKTRLVTLLYSPCNVVQPTMPQPQYGLQYPAQPQFPPQFQNTPQSMQQPPYAPQPMPQYPPQPMDQPMDQSGAMIWSYCPCCATPIDPGTVYCPRCATKLL